MRPFNQKLPFAKRDILIQGDSVRQIWGVGEPEKAGERKPIRRDLSQLRALPQATSDPLRLRLAEELEYARRMLDVTADELSKDPLAVSRHTVSLQYLDKVGQMICHIANIVRSSDPWTTVEAIGMGDLKARLTRSGAL